METKPLRTLNSVLEWNTGGEEVSCCCASMRAVQNETSFMYKTESSQKVLVCHDMMGGYLDDRFHDTVCSENQYVFYRWELIDIFVYFSHNLVTIPPSAWVKAATRHGVKILGTFITEWDDGARICDELLGSEETWVAFAQKLVEIAKFHGFLGWLVNIENPIQKDHIPALRNFLLCLTDWMHDAIPESLVIWYDSVTDTGKLKWQNQLNLSNMFVLHNAAYELNNRLRIIKVIQIYLHPTNQLPVIDRGFFSQCDGIFLNYNWGDSHLQMSRSVAGQRSKDVFVGVDVHGRGCFGGGGFNTCAAVEKIHRFGLSVAIFGHGWVYENHEKKTAAFLCNENKFWNKLHSFLPPRPINHLPISTNFCRGFGSGFYVEGRKVSDKCWYNLALQQRQPHICEHERSEVFLSQGDAVPLVCYSLKAFEGGGCLKITGHSMKTIRLPLFSSDILLSSSTKFALTLCIDSPASIIPSDENIDLIISSDNQESRVFFRSPSFSSIKLSDTNWWVFSAHLKFGEDNLPPFHMKSICLLLTSPEDPVIVRVGKLQINSTPQDNINTGGSVTDHSVSIECIGSRISCSSLLESKLLSNNHFSWLLYFAVPDGLDNLPSSIDEVISRCSFLFASSCTDCFPASGQQKPDKVVIVILSETGDISFVIT